MAPLLQGGLDFYIISIIIKTEREEYLYTGIKYGGFKNFRDALLSVMSDGAAAQRCLKELKKSIKDKSG